MQFIRNISKLSFLIVPLRQNKLRIAFENLLLYLLAKQNNKVTGITKASGLIKIVICKHDLFKIYILLIYKLSRGKFYVTQR